MRLDAAARSIKAIRERLRKTNKSVKDDTREDMFNVVARAVDVLAEGRQTATSLAEYDRRFNEQILPDMTYIMGRLGVEMPATDLANFTPWSLMVSQPGGWGDMTETPPGERAAVAAMRRAAGEDTTQGEVSLGAVGRGELVEESSQQEEGAWSLSQPLDRPVPQQPGSHPLGAVPKRNSSVTCQGDPAPEQQALPAIQQRGRGATSQGTHRGPSRGGEARTDGGEPLLNTPLRGDRVVEAPGSQMGREAFRVMQARMHEQLGPVYDHRAAALREDRTENDGARLQERDRRRRTLPPPQPPFPQGTEQERATIQAGGRRRRTLPPPPPPPPHERAQSRPASGLRRGSGPEDDDDLAWMRGTPPPAYEEVQGDRVQGPGRREPNPGRDQWRPVELEPEAQSPEPRRRGPDPRLEAVRQLELRQQQAEQQQEMILTLLQGMQAQMQQVQQGQQMPPRQPQHGGVEGAMADPPPHQRQAQAGAEDGMREARFQIADVRHIKDFDASDEETVESALQDFVRAARYHEERLPEAERQKLVAFLVSAKITRRAANAIAPYAAQLRSVQELESVLRAAYLPRDTLRRVQDRIMASTQGTKTINKFIEGLVDLRYRALQLDPAGRAAYDAMILAALCQRSSRYYQDKLQIVRPRTWDVAVDYVRDLEPEEKAVTFAVPEQMNMAVARPQQRPRSRERDDTPSEGRRGGEGRRSPGGPRGSWEAPQRGRDYDRSPSWHGREYDRSPNWGRRNYDRNPGRRDNGWWGSRDSSRDRYEGRGKSPSHDPRRYEERLPRGQTMRSRSATPPGYRRPESTRNRQREWQRDYRHAQEMGRTDRRSRRDGPNEEGPAGKARQPDMEELSRTLQKILQELQDARRPKNEGASPDGDPEH